jgi:biopolymer transport protein ExbB/TolQ
LSLEASELSLLSVLENGLFALGQVLRFPVMALLWVCVAAALFMAGSCLMEFVARRRERAGFRIEAWLRQGAVLGAADSRLAQLPATLRKLAADVDQERGGAKDGGLEEGALEHLVMESEERVRSLLTGPRALVKVGPSLGLLGTLIPMGTSLASLAAGNLEAMAGQMIVAFTTTIIGLATGTLAYAVSVVRQGWVNQDVREQRFFAERIASELAAPQREFAGRR